MLCHLIHCNGYKLIRSVNIESLAELPPLCLAAEQELDDGYAVFAQHDGKGIADAEGVYSQRDNGQGIADEGREYRDAIDRACGYLD